MAHTTWQQGCENRTSSWKDNKPSALETCHYHDVPDLATRSRARSGPVLSRCRAFGIPVLASNPRHPSEVHKIEKASARYAVYSIMSLSDFAIKMDSKAVAKRHPRRNQSCDIQKLFSTGRAHNTARRLTSDISFRAKTSFNTAQN
jgi:hypothetical protein